MRDDAVRPDGTAEKPHLNRPQLCGSTPSLFVSAFFRAGLQQGFGDAPRVVFWGEKGMA
jgi:hypothetical protein